MLSSKPKAIAEMLYLIYILNYIQIDFINMGEFWRQMFVMDFMYGFHN